MIAAYLRDRLHNALWGEPDIAQPRRKLIALRILRTLVVLFRDTARGQLTLRAMSLVYTSLLSLVPFLALSFSVLKAFGAHNEIQPFLEGILAPLGDHGVDIANQIITFIEHMNVGVLGSMGLALLAYTSVSLIQKIEESFNFIWHIAHPRRFGERFSRYLSLLLVGPILVFTALGLTATVMNADIVRRILSIEPFGHLYFSLSRVMPYLLVIAAFTFTYYFLPNTRVQMEAALFGGVVAGVAWQTAGRGFAQFVVATGRYQAIYSSFAILLLFMIWLYLSWRILLLGASVAFYYQHPEYLVPKSGEPRLSNRMRERLALAVTSCIGTHFLCGQAPFSVDELARRLEIPTHAIQVVLDALEQHGLVARTDGDAYLPARQLSAISVEEILKIVRSTGEEHYLSPADLPLPPRVDEVLQRIDETLERALGNLSLEDIARPEGAGAPDRRQQLNSWPANFRRSPARPQPVLAHRPPGLPNRRERREHQTPTSVP